MPYNSSLDQFLMFYSQSDSGNGLTRGLESDLAQRTYVQTRLDRELAPAILEGRFRLVILTGNAGDGKTAFIQMVEKLAAQQGLGVTRQGSLGAELRIAGQTCRTLYDGSVDSDSQSNMEMLQEFLAPFEGDTEPRRPACLIMAMNEGKLTDFLSHSTRHRWLSRTLLGHLRKNDPLPADIAVVNLNLRSVVDAKSGPGDCLFDRILDRYVANEFWTACESCPAKDKCPVKFNVDTFRLVSIEGLSGRDAQAVAEHNEAASIARTRLKAIFQILHFRKRIHITVRDLRSVLAFTLFGKRTCAEIVAEIQSGTTDFMDRYYYSAIFNVSERERILEFVREFDVGLASTPQVDSRLSFTRPRTADFRRLFLDYTQSGFPGRGRTNIDEDDLLRLYSKRPSSPEERTPEALEAARSYVVSLRRKLFFEGNRQALTGSPATVWAELLPYDNLLEYMRFVETGADAGGTLKEKLVEGISRSEGIYDAVRSRENICIRTRQDVDAKVKAFFTYPAADFALDLPRPGLQASYVEYLPSCILFHHAQRKVTLEISLDLYEMLMRIRDGYLPGAGEMRTFFLNLLMFKKQLMSTPSAELLLTETDYQVFKLRRTPQNAVVLGTL
jgi:hypothetical protein